MNTKRSPENQGKESRRFGKKAGSTMISTIDRKRIFIFVAIAYGFSIAMGLVIFNTYRKVTAPGAGVLLVALMFASTIANIATRLITHEGWSNTFLRVDLRRGRWRYYLAAWFLPPMATLVGAAIYYLLFPGRFDASMTYARQPGVASIGSGMDPWLFFITQVGIAMVRPFSEALLLSFGVEFGWRAYLQPKLMPLGPRKAAVLVGVIWAVWHWPAIFLGFNYGFGYWGAPVAGPLLFVLVLIFQSAFYAWVTLRSGSVWPAAIAHGAINSSNRLALIFGSGEPNALIGPGFQGIIGALGYVALGLLIFLSPRALAQTAPAPVDMALAENAEAPGKAADQAKLGTAS
jgi:membrane protease YdiL (CAAX protease family)